MHYMRIYYDYSPFPSLKPNFRSTSFDIHRSRTLFNQLTYFQIKYTIIKCTFMSDSDLKMLEHIIIGLRFMTIEFRAKFLENIIKTIYGTKKH